MTTDYGRFGSLVSVSTPFAVKCDGCGCLYWPLTGGPEYRLGVCSGCVDPQLREAYDGFGYNR